MPWLYRNSTKVGVSGAASFSSLTVGIRFSLNWYGDQPPMTRTHCPLRRALGLLADHGQAALQRIDAVPAQLQVVEAPAADRVRVRVVEARDDGAAAGVDDAGLRRRGRPPSPHRSPTATNLPSFTAKAVACGRCASTVMDLGVGHDQVGRLSLRCG